MKRSIGKQDGIVEDKGAVFDVTQEEYDTQLEQGFEDDEILRPGRHVFKTVPKHRVAAHADRNPSNTKVQITMKVDLDILNYFKARSRRANAAPYQTQINAELRAVMERDQADSAFEIKSTAKELLKNDEFLKALSKKLKEEKLVAL